MHAHCGVVLRSVMLGGNMLMVSLQPSFFQPDVLNEEPCVYLFGGIKLGQLERLFLLFFEHAPN